MGDVTVQDWQRYAMKHPCRSADEYTESHRHTIIRGGVEFYVGVYFHWERPSAAIWIGAVCMLHDGLIVPLRAVNSQGTAEFLTLGKMILAGCGKSAIPMLLPPEDLGYRFVKAPTEYECALAREAMDLLPPMSSILKLENIDEAQVKEWMNGTFQADARGSQGNRSSGQGKAGGSGKRAIRLDP